MREAAAAKTINLEVGTLRAILIRNRLWEPIRQDVRMLKVEDTPGKALTHERLLAACLESRSRGLYPSVVLALNTGMRSAELRWLRWKQIDLRAGSIRVGRSKTAAGAGRTIPLNRRTLEAVKEWTARFEDREPEHYVFPSEKYGHSGIPTRSMRQGAASTTSNTQHARGCSRRSSLRILAQIMGWRPRRRSPWRSATGTSATAHCGGR